MCLYMGHCQISPCHIFDTRSGQLAAKWGIKPQTGFVDAQVCLQPFGRVWTYPGATNPLREGCLPEKLPVKCSHGSKCAQGLGYKTPVHDCLWRKRRGPEATLYSERKVLKKVGAACAAFHHLWKAFLKADTVSNFFFCSKVLKLQMATSWHSHPLCERIAEITQLLLSLWY